MNAPLTPQDWEFLSTYLDGPLSPLEQSRAQDVISRRPELGLALEELRRTRAVLRAAPRRRAPRNFTLTPAMARQARPRSGFSWGWVPSLSFGSALATLLLVLSFFVRLPGAGLPAAAAPAPMTVQAPLAAQGPLAADRVLQEKSLATQATASPPIILWNDVGRGGGDGSPPGAGATSPLATQGNPILPQGDAPPSDAAPGAAAATVAPRTAAPLAATPAEAAANTNGPILGVAPADQRGQMLTAVPSLAERVQPISYTPAEAQDHWWQVQLGLGLAALLFALAALEVWRRARR